jgi:hypothetical protein
MYADERIVGNTQLFRELFRFANQGMLKQYRTETNILILSSFFFFFALLQLMH